MKQRASVLALLLLAFVGLSGTSCRRDVQPRDDRDTTSDAKPWFEEVGGELGIGFRQIPFENQQFYFPEISAGGVCLFDYDNDGNLDIYFVQGGHLDPSAAKGLGNELYRNRGDGTFEQVSEKAGVSDTGYGMGCTCGDYDGDGDVDLYVTNVEANVLYENNGDGTFTDVTVQSGVGDKSWSASSAFLDYDADGDLDLFVTNYIHWSPERELICRTTAGTRDYCDPKNYQSPARDTLYRNQGDGTFVDVTDASGLGVAFGNGFGVATGDFNGDGRLDIYVANDQVENQLWLGGEDLKFTNRALLFGCALSGAGSPEAGMGVVAVDVENDGDLDLFLSHLRNESNTFYTNNDGMFDDMTAGMRLASPSLPMTGFGLGFADFNHDGVQDVFVANGRVTNFSPQPDPRDPYAESNLLLTGQLKAARVIFDEVKPTGGTAEILLGTSRGAAFGDLDNDGDIDIVVVNIGKRAHVLRNIADKDRHWVMFRVLNPRGNYALGATVRIRAGGKTQWRTVQRAYSFCASNDPRIHFGLGSHQTVDEIMVRWPNGKEEVFGVHRADEIHTLSQNQGKPAVAP